MLSDINFNGHCLINNNISIPKKLIYLNIAYIPNPWIRSLDTGFILKNCLFRSVKLTKNPDQDKYKYSGYGIWFDSCSEFLFIDEGMGKNVMIFGADMVWSVDIGNKNKDILILGEGPSQGLDDAALTAKAKYPIKFIQPGKRFV